MAGCYCIFVVFVVLSLSSVGDSGTMNKNSWRWKRSVTEYHVDVVAFVDLALYQKWYDWSGQKKQDAVNNINRYFTLLFDGRSRFKGINDSDYRLSVRLVDIQIATSMKSPIASLTSKSSVDGRIEAKSVLEKITSYIILNNNRIPLNDHIMLFTGYNLISEDSGILFTSTVGKAYVNSTCLKGGKSVSVVEDSGGFISIHTATHELGHSLGADHDGTNSCRMQDRYIMAGKSNNETEANMFNPWFFSPCSIAEFKNFIDRTLQSEDGQSCLQNTLTKSQNVVDVSGLQPGQLYSPDEACQHIYGSQSFYCRGKEFGNVTGICLHMSCNNPNNKKYCIELHASQGTSCGDRKWCENGRCVPSEQAPSQDEACVHGDQPFYKNNGQSCEQLVKQYSAYCYDENIQTYCCQTCKKILKHIPGCEYGDKVGNCNVKYCNAIYPNGKIVDLNCCGTCRYNPSTWSCTDSTASTGIDCSSIESYKCYNTTIAFHCCKKCGDIRNIKAKDCEYGDKTSKLTCNSLTNYGQSCINSAYPGLDKFCCRTCTKFSAGRGSSFMNSSCSHWLLLLALEMSMLW